MELDTSSASRPCYSPRLEAVQPCQDIFFVIPIDEFIQFSVVFKSGLGVLNKFLLHRAFVSQIHMQIDHGGVDIFMTQAVFNIGNGFTAAKHIHGSRVEPLLRQYQL